MLWFLFSLRMFIYKLYFVINRKIDSGVNVNKECLDKPAY